MKTIAAAIALMILAAVPASAGTIYTDPNPFQFSTHNYGGDASIWTPNTSVPTRGQIIAYVNSAYRVFGYNQG